MNFIAILMQEWKGLRSALLHNTPLQAFHWVIISRHAERQVALT